VEHTPRGAEIEAYPALGFIKGRTTDQKGAEQGAQNPEQGNDQNKIKEDPFVERDAHLSLFLTLQPIGTNRFHDQGSLLRSCGAQ
jgi:hypothetical protein